MRGAPHNGFAWLMFRIKPRISAGTFGLPGRRRDFRVQYQAKAYGAKRSLYRGERCVDSGANRATIVTARPTKAGRTAGGANAAVHSSGKPRVDDEARGSPPAGRHGFENWRRPKRKGQQKESSS